MHTSETEAKTATEYESVLFNTDSIMTVDIIMDEDEWQDFLDNAANEEYYRCDVIVNGETFRNVGIRAKGNTSLSNIAKDDTTDRYSIKIEFDKYVTGQTCHGLDKLILNNSYADSTYMKEALIYDMFAYLSADASLYNYSKLSVNGEYFGLYIALEAVEESFLTRNYGTLDGKLYKPENMDGSSRPSGQEGENHMPGQAPGDLGGENHMPSQAPGDLGGENHTPGQAPGESDGNTPARSREDNRQQEGQDPKKENRMQGPGNGGPGGRDNGGSDLNYSDDDLDSYSTIWEGAVNDSSSVDHRRVVAALKAISEGNTEDIEKYMDVDNILKYMAVHEFAVNGDSLSGNMAHNYYLYEYGGQVNIIPWDYNLAFGGMGGGKGGMGDRNNDGDRSNKGATSTVNDPIDDSWDSTSFFDVLLENEEYSKRYHEYLQMLVDYVEGGRYEELTKRIHSQIDDLVKSDPTAFYTYDEYTDACSVLDEVVSLRAKSIKGQLDGTIPSTAEGQKADSSGLIDASDIDTSVMGTMNMK